MLIGGVGDDYLSGLSSGDSLDGGSGDDTLIGGKNNDTLTGGAGNDKFIYTTGSDADRITDFAAGAGIGDVISLVDMGPSFDTFSEVMAAASQSGSNVVITFGTGSTITLLGVTLSSLNADDFLFG